MTDPETQLIEDPLPEPQDENDMLGLTENISYNKPHWENVDNGNDADGNPIEDVTSGLTCGRDTEDITGEGSIRSWYFAATAEANFSPAVAQLRLGQSYDLTGKGIAFDIKFESDDPNATQKFSVKLHNSNWGDLTVERGVRVDQGGWHRVVVDFTESMVEGKDLSDVSFITFIFDFAGNTGAARKVNIDNVQPAELKDINQDMSDMGTDAGMSSAPVYYKTSDKSYGDSLYSYKIVTATGANEFTLHAQNAVDQGRMENYLDMSSSILNGYFWFGDVEPYAALSITEGTWAKSLFSPFTFEAKGDGWYYGTLNSHDILYDDSDTEAGATGDMVRRITLQLPENAIVYVDQLTATEIDPEPKDPHDLLGDLKYFVYDKEDWGEELGLTYGRSEDMLYGNASIRSWFFHASAEASNDFTVAQFRLKKVHDMSDCTLLVDVYYESDSPEAQTIGVRMHNSNWGNINDINKTFDVTANEWTTIVVDFSSVINEGADLTDLRFITFVFDFEANTSYERTVYLDNVRLYRAETVREDWVNMSQDSGSFYKNTETNITNDVDAIQAEGSYQGLYVKAPADTAGKVTFNTDQAVVKDEIDALPDLTSGTLGAWFYFGDMEPAAHVVLTDYNWKGSRGVDFTFGENQNGWYYGTLDCSKFTYSETDNPGLIRRIMINLPAGFEGYIDGLTYTPLELPAELKFAAANMMLHYDLSINFKANKSLFGEGMFTDPYVTYAWGDTVYTVTEYTEDNNRYAFKLEHIRPAQINDTMVVTLYATYNGTVVRSTPMTYSLATYCYSLLGKDVGSTTDELHTLLVDILNYGSLAQVAFNYKADSLANAKLTAQQAALGTSGDVVIRSKADSAYKTVEAPTATWMAANLVLQNSIGIRFHVKVENPENVSIVFKTEHGYSFTFTKDALIPIEGSENEYYIYFNQLNATMVRTCVYATVYQGDTAISNTLRYSIESYVYSMKDDATYGALVKAIMYYGASASAYYQALKNA